MALLTQQGGWLAGWFIATAQRRLLTHACKACKLSLRLPTSAAADQQLQNSCIHANKMDVQTAHTCCVPSHAAIPNTPCSASPLTLSMMRLYFATRLAAAGSCTPESPLWLAVQLLAANCGCCSAGLLLRLLLSLLLAWHTVRPCLLPLLLYGAELSDTATLLRAA